MPRRSLRGGQRRRGVCAVQRGCLRWGVGVDGLWRLRGGPICRRQRRRSVCQLRHGQIPGRDGQRELHELRRGEPLTDHGSYRLHQLHQLRPRLLRRARCHQLHQLRRRHLRGRQWRRGVRGMRCGHCVAGGVDCVRELRRGGLRGELRRGHLYAVQCGRRLGSDRRRGINDVHKLLGRHIRGSGGFYSLRRLRRWVVRDGDRRHQLHRVCRRQLRDRDRHQNVYGLRRRSRLGDDGSRRLGAVPELRRGHVRRRRGCGDLCELCGGYLRGHSRGHCVRGLRRGHGIGGDGCNGGRGMRRLRGGHLCRVECRRLHRVRGGVVPSRLGCG